MHAGYLVCSYFVKILGFHTVSNIVGRAFRGPIHPSSHVSMVSVLLLLVITVAWYSLMGEQLDESGPSE